MVGPKCVLLLYIFFLFNLPTDGFGKQTITEKYGFMMFYVKFQYHTSFLDQR